MKKILYLFFSVIVLSYMSCTDDNSGTTDTAPIVDLSSDQNYIHDAAQVDRATYFKVKVIAAKGTNKLKSLTVQENGKTVDLSRVKIAGNAASANPTLLFAPDDDGFTWEVEVLSVDTPGLNTYSFLLTDTKGLTDDISVEITTLGKAVKEYTALRMSNKNGPNKSGVDLTTGTIVFSTDASADIIDIGNATNSNNWLKRVFGVNGTLLNKPATGFNYNTVKYVDDLKEAFDAGTTTGSNNDLEMFDGDSFLAKTSDGKYYVIKVTKVQITASDNADYVELSVKSE